MKILGFVDFDYLLIEKVLKHTEDKRKAYILSILEQFKSDCLIPTSCNFKEKYSKGFSDNFKYNYLEIFRATLNTAFTLEAPFSYLLINPLMIDRKHIRSIVSNHEFNITEDNKYNGVLRLFAIIKNIETNEVVDKITIYRITLTQLED